jgi:hypothetical protein
LHYIDGVLSINTSKFGDYNPFDLDINDKDICIYGVHSFLGNTVGQIYFNMSFSCVEKSND